MKKKGGENRAYNNKMDKTSYLTILYKSKETK
jgi:hypothetical protein